MRIFSWKHFFASVILMYFSGTVAQAKVHHAKYQPALVLDSAGVGAGVAYHLTPTTDLHMSGSSAGAQVAGSGSYYISGANGANPVLLNLDFTEKIHLGNLSFTLDQYLKRNKPFFLSAGFVENYLRLDADTIPATETVVFAGTQYSAPEIGVLGIHARWPTLCPYFGFGWAASNPDGSQRGLRWEVGAYRIGQASITYTTEGVVSANPAIFNPYLESLRGTLVHDLSGLKIYPVLRMSVPIGK